MPPERSDTAYRLSGTFFELCDCTTVCPCWVGLAPTDDRCTGAFGWSIKTGRIGGVNVGGLQVVSVSFHSGHRDTGGQEVFLYVDEAASPEQYERLVAAFTGALGGQLGELQALMGTLRLAEPAAIELKSEGAFMSITVDHRVSGDAQVLLGADGDVMALSHGRLSNVLGPVAEVGQSAAFRVDMGDQSFGVEVRGRAAMRGPFKYRFDGAPA